MSRFVSVSVLLLLVYGNVCGQEKWGSAKDSIISERRTPDHEFALGVGVRVDSEAEVDADPMIRFKYFRYIGEKTALVSQLGYSHRTEFGWGSDASTVAFGIGIRLEPPSAIDSWERYFLPFVEFLYSVHRYSGNLEAQSYAETRTGIGFSVGISFRIDKTSRMDIGVEQVFNNAGSRPVYAPEALPDDYGDYPVFVDWMGGPDAYDLYNPAVVFIQYRFEL